MPLYVTPKGQWSSAAGQAAQDARQEGSDPEAVQLIDFPFPATKADVLALLNRLAVKAPVAPQRATTDPEDPRWRVYCRGVFVGATRAPDPQGAVANIAAELSARPSG